MTARLLCIVNQQISLLRRSIANLVTLHQLSLPSCPPTPVGPRPVGDPSTWPELKRESNDKQVAIQIVLGPYATQMETQGLRSQLAKAQRMRLQILCQTVAVLSIAITFLTLSGEWYVSSFLQDRELKP